MSVIHGSGKPRFYIRTTNFPLSCTVTSATATSVLLNTAESLTNLDAVYTFINRLIFVEDIDGNETMGKVTAYDNNTKVVTVAGWSKDLPSAGKTVQIRDFQIDLPYCQELLEWFEPDVLSRKLSNGNIDNKKKGFYYKAILDYSSYMTSTDLESLRSLYRIDFKEAEFFPRIDNYNLSYIVDIDPESQLEFAQLYHQQGHKYVKIAIKGLRRLSEANLYSPVTAGYGDPPYGGSEKVGYGDVY